MDGDVFWNRGLNAVNPCGAYCCAAPLRLGQLQDRNLRRHIYSRLICTVWQNRGGRRTKPSKTVQKGSRVKCAGLGWSEECLYLIRELILGATCGRHPWEPG